ncbi:MAG: type II toxin-antitoxin system HipA family toxin [Fibrobacterales bacterium]
MVKRVDVATVSLFGEMLGAIAWDEGRECGLFEYDSSFLKKGISVSPYFKQGEDGSIVLENTLDPGTYKGLPGFLADSLPDDFGNAVINAWLSRQGRKKSSFSPVERLCFTGMRGMGALEFQPEVQKAFDRSMDVEISELIELSNSVLQSRKNLAVNMDMNEDDALREIISVGTSAGGQRPKAVLAIHPNTGQVKSGQVTAPKGFEYWLLKFDGVGNTVPGVIADPQGYGRIEYAYSQMAQACGITMTDCKVWEENGRAHFMTKRFDRFENGQKLHMLTLCGMAHFDYRKPGYYGYEQAFDVMREIKLPHSQAEQLFRRMVFNVVSRNQDDHTKNISFLMDVNGRWSLSPAYDVTYSYNPNGQWTNKHQMTINGKRDGFTLKDLITVGRGIRLQDSEKIIREICDVVGEFSYIAEKCGIDAKVHDQLSSTFRLDIV